MWFCFFFFFKQKTAYEIMPSLVGSEMCIRDSLWTLPMFHCNGWCFTWGVTAAGATHLCLRKVDPALIWRHLRESNVTHLSAAPTVLIMLAWAQEAALGKPRRAVRVATGGAPPTPALLTRMAELGMEVTHLYGLTETFGPAAICEWRADWSKLAANEQAQIKARHSQIAAGPKVSVSP